MKGALYISLSVALELSSVVVGCETCQAGRLTSGFHSFLEKAPPHVQDPSQ